MNRLAVVLALALAAAACGTDDDPPSAPTGSTAPPPSTTTPPPATDGAPATTAATAGALEGVTVTLTALAYLEAPTAMAMRAGDDAIYIAEQVGRVRVLRPDPGTDPPTYTVDDEPLVDISDDVSAGGEQGLLGLAFSPDGDSLYLAYTEDGGDQQQVDVYRLDGGDRTTVIEVDDFAGNHNGGDISFGPDGFLYYSMGDGGGGGDPEDTGQDPSDLLGNLLRIDPEGATGGDPYAIPEDNPFAGGDGAPEVWTYGLRNPWRFSFDRETGDLWIGDVGQGEYEEIDFLPAASGAGRGANLGWSEREGLHAYDDGGEVDGAVDPIFEYDHSGAGCAVTGGFVYRGSRIPALVGAYVWGDYCIGDLHAFVQEGGAIVAQADLAANTPSLSSFGQDLDGELYALSLDGTVYRIDP